MPETIMSPEQALELIQSIVMWTIGVLGPIVTALITAIVVLWRKNNKSQEECKVEITALHDEFKTELLNLHAQVEERNKLLVGVIDANASEITKASAATFQLKDKIQDLKEHNTAHNTAMKDQFREVRQELRFNNINRRSE